MVVVPKLRWRQFRRQFRSPNPGGNHVVTRLSGCLLAIVHVPMPALGQGLDNSMGGTSQSNDISSIGLVLLLLIVVIASLFFLRGVLCYLHINRLGNNTMDSAPVVTSSQEDYVLKGKSVISSNLEISAGKWILDSNVGGSEGTLQGRLTRIELVMDLGEETAQTGKGRGTVTAGHIRGDCNDPLGKSLIVGRYKHGMNRVAWTQTYHGNNNLDIKVHALGKLYADPRGQTIVRGSWFSPEGGGTRGQFTLWKQDEDASHDHDQDVSPFTWKDAGSRDVPAHLLVRSSASKCRIELKRLEDGVASNNICCICQDECHCDASSLPCGHTFHSRCIQTWLKNWDECPTCQFLRKGNTLRSSAERASDGSVDVAVSIQPEQSTRDISICPVSQARASSFQSIRRPTTAWSQPERQESQNGTPDQPISLMARLHNNVQDAIAQHRTPRVNTINVGGSPSTNQLSGSAEFRRSSSSSTASFRDVEDQV